MNTRKALSASAAFILGAAVAAPTAIWTWENVKPKEVKVQSSVPTPTPKEEKESSNPVSAVSQTPSEQTATPRAQETPTPQVQTSATNPQPQTPETALEIVPERPVVRERVHVYHRPATTIFGYELDPERIIATFESGEKHIYTYRQVQHDNSRCAELATFERRSANPTLAPFYKGPLEHAPIKAFTGHRHGQKFHMPEGIQFTAPEHGFHHPEPTPAPVVVEQPAPTVVVQQPKPVVIQQPAPTVVVQQPKPVVIQQPAPVYVAPTRPNSYIVTPTHTHCTSRHHGHHHHSCRTGYTLRPSSYVVPMGQTTPYFSNLTYRVPTTTYVRPQVHYVQPSITYVRPRVHYVQPSVTYVRPRVHYVQPSVTYVRPRVRYVQPTYRYVQPTRVHYSYRYVERHHPTTVRVVRHDYRPHRVIRHHGYHGHDRHVRHYNYVHVR